MILGAWMVFVSACDNDEITDPCCKGLAVTKKARELEMQYAFYSVSPGAMETITHVEALHTPSLNEYLCSIYPDLKDLNFSYERSNDEKFNKVCSESIGRYDAFLADVKKAYTECCVTLSPDHAATGHSFYDVYRCEKKEDAKEMEDCWNQKRAHEIKYASCFVTYLSTGVCEGER